MRLHLKTTRSYGSLVIKPLAIFLALSVLPGCAIMTGGPQNLAITGTNAIGTGVNQTVSGLSGAVVAPLQDFNFAQQAIPPALLLTEANPYDVKSFVNCQDLAKTISSLDEALGPDVDLFVEDQHEDAYNFSARFAAQTAFETVKGAAEGVVPMKSWVRKLSGAERRDKQVHKAILSGTIRRAFLKGLGVMHGCVWPAAPLGFLPPPEVKAPISEAKTGR